MLFGGFELEGGVLYRGFTHYYEMESNDHASLRFGGYIAIRAGLSLMLGSSFEMRLDPLGVMVGVAGFEYDKPSDESDFANGAGLILAWYPAFNLAVRF